MQLRVNILPFLAHQFWARLPRFMQHGISGLHAVFYQMRWSRVLVKPYAWIQYGANSGTVFREFSPASGSRQYENFQDFFSRRLSVPRSLGSSTVWPCDGLLCETLKVDTTSVVNIKGERRHIRAIFGDRGDEIPDGAFFTNVFLHNRDYHRIHSPVTAKVVWVERLSGDLRLLRPWAYKHTSPSIPALTNERVNVCLIDHANQKWFLSIVGGPGVATIEGFDHLVPGTKIECGSELATFKMGSTCCMVSPVPVSTATQTYVRMGDSL